MSKEALSISQRMNNGIDNRRKKKVKNGWEV